MEGQRNHERSAEHCQRLPRWTAQGERTGWVRCVLCPNIRVAVINAAVQSDHLRGNGHCNRLLAELQAGDDAAAAAPSSQLSAEKPVRPRVILRAVAAWTSIDGVSLRCDCCPSFKAIHKNNLELQHLHENTEAHRKAYEMRQQAASGASFSAGQPPDSRKPLPGSAAAAGSGPSSAAPPSFSPSNVWIPERAGWLKCRVCDVLITSSNGSQGHMNEHVNGIAHRKKMASQMPSAPANNNFNSYASATGQPPDNRPRYGASSSAAPCASAAGGPFPPFTRVTAPRAGNKQARQKQLSEWFSNKRGVVVTLPANLPDLGRFQSTQIPSVCVGREAVFRVQVRTTSVDAAGVRVVGQRFIHFDPRKQLLTDMRPEADRAFRLSSVAALLPSNHAIPVDLQITPTQAKGKVYTHLLIDLQDVHGPFSILRSITVHMANAGEQQPPSSAAAGSDGSAESGGNGGNGEPPKKRLNSWERRLKYARRSQDSRLIVSAPPPDGRNVPSVVRLNHYDLPHELKREMPSEATKIIITNVQVSAESILCKASN